MILNSKIDFEKIRSLVEAASYLEEAGEIEAAKRTLVTLSDMIDKEIK